MKAPRFIHFSCLRGSVTVDHQSPRDPPGPPSLGLVQSDLKSDCCEYQDLQSAKSHFKCLYSLRSDFKCLYSLRSDCKSDRAGREGGRCRPPWLSGPPSLGLVQSDLKSDCCEYQDLQSAKSHYKCLYSLRSDCKSDRTGVFITLM